MCGLLDQKSPGYYSESETLITTSHESEKYISN
jgi:hypothetical protein